MRIAAHTSETITALSDGTRQLRVLFLRDGVVDDGEMAALRQFRSAMAAALRADWSRRARQSVENSGTVGPRLLRERGEIEREFPAAGDAAWPAAENSGPGLG